MKKALFSATLALAVACSWAFYPKPAGQPARMMVVGSFTINGFGATATLTTISPTGEMTDEEINAKLGSKKATTDVMLRIHAAELAKVQALSQEGWKLTHVTPTSAGYAQLGMSQTVYLLEK